MATICSLDLSSRNGAAEVDLQLFSDDDDEDYDDRDNHDRSFFEIAIHQTNDDDVDDEEEEFELRISFSSAPSSFVTSSFLWPVSNADVSKSRGQRDLLVTGDDRESPFSSDFGSSSAFFSSSSAGTALPELDVAEKTTGRRSRVAATGSARVPLSAVHLDSNNRDRTPANFPRKSSEKLTSPTVSNGSGILSFLIKFPAAIKLQKILASFAKATANTPPVAVGHTSKTTSSHLNRRLRNLLNKWIMPMRNEVGLKNMKSFCSFDHGQCEMDRTIIITANDKSTMKTKRRGISEPSSIKSSPAHRVIDGCYDHNQSSIQAAIAHCRRSSTPDFCFSTPHDRPF